MRTTPVAITAGFQQLQTHAVASVQPAPLSTAVEGDQIQISDDAQARIASFEAGITSLEQAIRESRQQVRAAAANKISMAHEYLKQLRRMSTADDPAAAREAARIAREIRGAAESFRMSMTREELTAAGADTAAIVGEAGKALAIAKEMIERYLRTRKTASKKDSDLRDSVSNAITALHGLVHEGIAAGLQPLAPDPDQSVIGS